MDRFIVLNVRNLQGVIGTLSSLRLDVDHGQPTHEALRWNLINRLSAFQKMSWCIEMGTGVLVEPDDASKAPRIGIGVNDRERWWLRARPHDGRRP